MPVTAISSAASIDVVVAVTVVVVVVISVRASRCSASSLARSVCWRMRAIESARLARLACQLLWPYMVMFRSESSWRRAGNCRRFRSLTRRQRRRRRRWHSQRLTMLKVFSILARLIKKKTGIFAFKKCRITLMTWFFDYMWLTCLRHLHRRPHTRTHI